MEGSEWKRSPRSDTPSLISRLMIAVHSKAPVARRYSVIAGRNGSSMSAEGAVRAATIPSTVERNRIRYHASEQSPRLCWFSFAVFLCSRRGWQWQQVLHTLHEHICLYSLFTYLHFASELTNNLFCIILTQRLRTPILQYSANKTPEPQIEREQKSENRKTKSLKRAKH